MHNRDLLHRMASDRHLQDVEFWVERRITPADRAAADLLLMCGHARPRWRVHHMVRCLGEAAAGTHGVRLQSDMARRVHAAATLLVGRRSAPAVLTTALGLVIEGSILGAAAGRGAGAGMGSAEEYAQRLLEVGVQRAELQIGLRVKRLERIVASVLACDRVARVPESVSALCAVAMSRRWDAVPERVWGGAAPLLEGVRKVWPLTLSRNQLLWFGAAVSFFWLVVFRSRISRVEFVSKGV